MTLHADAAASLAAWQPSDRSPGWPARWSSSTSCDARPDGAWPVMRARAPHRQRARSSTRPADASCSCFIARSAAGCSPAATARPTDATLAAAALREATEESGIAGLRDRAGDPPRGSPPGAVQPRRGRRALRRPLPGAWRRRVLSRPVSAESLDVRWFGWDAMPDDRGDDDPGRMLRSAVRTRDVDPIEPVRQPTPTTGAAAHIDATPGHRLPFPAAASCTASLRRLAARRLL